MISKSPDQKSSTLKTQTHESSNSDRSNLQVQERENTSTDRSNLQVQERENTNTDRSAWRQRLVDAETGFRIGIRSESTLFVYFFIGCVIIGAATVLGLSAIEWGLVILSLGMALSTELINQLFRQLAAQATLKLPKELEEISRLGSAAVFVANLATVAVLATLFWPKISHLLQQ